MKLIRSLESTQLPTEGCVLTIGNFDAVHRGHQRIMNTLRSHGDRLGLPVMVMTFDPHPEEYFLGDKSSARLTECSTRYFALHDLKVDIMLLLRFNQKLANITADHFVRQILVERLRARYILVGDDFRFGKQRVGDFSLLQRFATQGKYTVASTETVLHRDERISSTRIRGLLAKGNLEAAAQLLGRRYNLVGRVGYGQQLGRQWGFPTLNIPIIHQPAVTGIFAVEVSGIDEDALPGVASLGTRPTIGDNLEYVLEVHLFDFDRSVYGERVCVEFVKKIRNEEKFDSFDQLKSRIGLDAGMAREILGIESRIQPDESK